MNIEFDPQLFTPTAPAGYEDISPPSDEREIAKIISALKLYAELSGGRYPQADAIEIAALRDELLRLAADKNNANAEKIDSTELRGKIPAAMEGFDWLRKILLFRFNSGYFGGRVTPADHEQVLLWWTAVPEKQYRIVYGDLRTEVVSHATWLNLVPPKDATSQ